VARIYLDEAFAGPFQDADVLLLGCTHYPLLKPLLSRIVPAQVQIVDSADSTASAAKQYADYPPNTKRSTAPTRFLVTDSVEKFQRLGARFLRQAIDHVEHVDLKE